MASKEELKSIYTDFVEDVGEKERNIVNEIEELDESIGVSDMLLRPPKSWEEEEKTLRSLPVVEVYEQGGELDRGVKEVLVGLDANINVLDDIIDTKNFEKFEKVELTANAAFSSLLSYRNINDEISDEFSRMVLDYLTELFQIPKVEVSAIRKIEGAEGEEEVLEAAKEAYRYRARDIDAFARAPAIIRGLPDEEKARKVEDLRVFRAKQLLVKDIYDIERDLEDGDTTPVIKIMQKHDNEEEVLEVINKLLDSFNYSHEAEGSYSDALDRFVRDFDSQTIEEKMTVINEDSSSGKSFNLSSGFKTLPLIRVFYK